MLSQAELEKEGKIITNLVDTYYHPELKIKAITSLAPEAEDLKNCEWLTIATNKKLYSVPDFSNSNQDILDYYEQNQNLCSHYDEIMQYHSPIFIGDSLNQD